MSTPGDRTSAIRGRRREVLDLLREEGATLSIADVAERLGVHLNTARFHLDALAERGAVERVRPETRRPGRPALMFRARRGMDATGPRRYDLLAGVLARTLAATPDGSARAAESGRAWGRELAELSGPASGRDEATDRLVALLDDFGFAPERRAADGAEQIGLRHCPFLEVAEHRADIVCPIHLGLMKGAMEQWTDEARVELLEPFVEPDLCLTHLGETRP